MKIRQNRVWTNAWQQELNALIQMDRWELVPQHTSQNFIDHV